MNQSECEVDGTTVGDFRREKLEGRDGGTRNVLEGKFFFSKGKLK